MQTQTTEQDDQMNDLLQKLVEMTKGNNIHAKHFLASLSGAISMRITDEVKSLQSQIENDQERISELKGAYAYLNQNTITANSDMGLNRTINDLRANTY